MPTEQARTDLPLTGRTVTRCTFDSGVVIEFLDGGPAINLRIKSRFTLTSNGESRRLDADDPSEVGRAVILLRQAVESAAAHGDGRLELRFENGARLDVPPDQDYEAWELGIAEVDGMRLVSLPGGGLETWGVRAPVQA